MKNQMRIAKRKRGRPEKPDAKKSKRFQIMLTSEHDAIAKKLGSGNRSKGIQLALETALARGMEAAYN